MKTFLKHQVGAVVATVVDFGTMIALVSGAGLLPAAGTAVGASAGAVTNFTLGRLWIFEARAGRTRDQAMRYAAVSAASLLLNTLGEHLLATILGVPYVLARVIVAVLVSVGWNFPLHRRFVFR